MLRYTMELSLGVSASSRGVIMKSPLGKSGPAESDDWETRAVADLY